MNDEDLIYKKLYMEDVSCIDEVGKIPWVIHHYKKYKWVKDLTRE